MNEYRIEYRYIQYILANTEEEAKKKMDKLIMEESLSECKIRKVKGGR